MMMKMYMYINLITIFRKLQAKLLKSQGQQRNQFLIYRNEVFLQFQKCLNFQRSFAINWILMKYEKRSFI